MATIENGAPVRVTRGQWQGRQGIVQKPITMSFPDYRYVKFFALPRERTVKIEVVALVDLERIPDWSTQGGYKWAFCRNCGQEHVWHDDHPNALERLAASCRRPDGMTVDARELAKVRELATILGAHALADTEICDECHLLRFCMTDGDGKIAVCLDCTDALTP